MKPVHIGEDVELRREDLSVTCESLYRRGWMPGTFGSASIRSVEAVLITADGLVRGMMSRQDTVLVDPFEGLPLLGETEWPPAATALHLAFYRQLPGCGAVIHAHTPYSTALAGQAGCTGQVVFEGLEMAKNLGVPDPRLVVLPVLANDHEASRTADDVRALLEGSPADAPPALLIERNGMVVWGRDLPEARNRLECLEGLSHLLLLTGADRQGAAEMQAR